MFLTSSECIQTSGKKLLKISLHLLMIDYKKDVETEEEIAIPLILLIIGVSVSVIEGRDLQNAFTLNYTVPLPLGLKPLFFISI